MKTPEQIQFQGSAQSRGFAPVTQASPTQLIEENTNRLLAGQARNFEMESANLDAVNALQRKFAKQDVDALAAMSGTLADVLTKEAERQNERDMQEGLNEAYMDGFSEDDMAAFDAQEAQLKATHEGINQYADAVQAGGAPFMGVQKVRELSGWKAYGYAMGMAQTAGQRYSTYMEQVMARVPVTATAAEKAAILSRARSQFLSQSGLIGMNPMLANKYAFPAMREADSTFLTKFRREEEKQIQDQMVDDAFSTYEQDPVANFSTTLTALVRSGRYDRRKAREELLGMLKDPGLIDDIGRSVSWDGKKSWAELYPQTFADARNRAVKGEIDNYDTSKAERALEGKRWFDQVQELWEKQPPSEQEIEEAKRKMSDDYDYIDSRLERWTARSTDAESTKYWTDYMERLDRSGGLTEAILNNPSVPYDVVQRFRSRAQQLDKARTELPEYKEYSKQLKADIMRAAKTNSLEAGPAGMELAIAAAEAEYQALFSRFIKSGADSSTAAANAYAKVVERIRSGADNFDKSSRYYLDPTKGFVNIIPTGTSAKDFESHKKYIDDKIKYGGVAAVSKYKLIPEATLQQVQQESEKPNFTPPPIAQYISNLTGGKLTPWQVLDAQLGTPVKRPVPVQAVESGISPEFQRLLNYRPSYRRVSRAYISQGTFNEALVPDGYGPIITRAATANGIPPAVLAGLIETESRWRPNAKSDAGAQGIAQIVPKWHPNVNTWDPVASIEYAAKHLKGLVAATGSLDEAIYAYNGGTGGIRKSKENREYYPKVMRAAAKYGYGAENGAWRNPALLHPRIAYVTGNIGPTSTGPHLDVKQTDGGNFSPTALDRYVEVDDPQKGRVPLSQVGVTAGQANHRARGSHGIDYGTASGSRVYLRGGARVLGTKSTVHGDQVTIELPSGKTYTFLHGKRA